MILGGHFDLDQKKQRLSELEILTNEPTFWDDIEMANEVNKEVSSLKKIVFSVSKIKEEISDYLELIPLISDEELLLVNMGSLKGELETLELNTLLCGEFDNLNCYLEIHPGAGGTESCDWASMLLRMYRMFCEKNGYSYETVEEQKGDEAGIKSVTILIKGEYAFGYLKHEKGIHRLVRISPFDSSSRRHTSFASVTVTPEYKKDIDVEIKESDLKIDVYHSSGAGGQSVNTANSAVRITHLPTKTVVTCQIERSQLRNKEVAMEMLKNKLYEQKLREQEEKLANITGENSNIDFGSQIRSYILEPYKLVKDHRSKYESTDPFKVLDGSILEFIESILKLK